MASPISTITALFKRVIGRGGPAPAPEPAPEPAPAAKPKRAKPVA